MAAPSSPRRTSSSKPGQKSSDMYYGHEDTARMCARFITALFSCPDVPPPSTSTSSSAPSAPSPTLAAFIAYALHRTRLNQSVTFCALFLLSRLKGRFPAARGSSGHRLFISAFMIASKVVCDDTYSNKSWCVVGQGMFSLREINQMEREMCSYLEWVLNVKPEELATFEAEVRANYGPGAKPQAVPPPHLIIPAAPQTAASSSKQGQTQAGMKPADVNPYPSPESSPPSPSHSDSSSPQSSEPRTPPTPDVPSRARSAIPNKVSAPTVSSKPTVASSSHQFIKVAVSDQSSQSRRDSSFAFAAPSVW
ncbi:hypothetical protein FRC03_000751 [Tulasnella sp. 419]|nr:hypothetical protein FRC02_000869 [Tulasnella sp. 418]KAG8965286.1 hypothetical protein FRC03_000751 [Tulasnella sp. 419]